MAVADHCARVLPKVTRDTAMLQVQCPVCLSMWIYEKGAWTQITVEEQRRQGLVIGE